MNEQNRKFVVYFILPTGILLFFLLSLSPTIFVTISSGQAGVVYKRFQGGTDTKSYLKEGFHLVAPWNNIFIYDIRTQEGSKIMDVLSSNGLSIRLNVSYRYSPKENDIGILHKKIGQRYLEKIVLPEISSAARKITGRYTLEELYFSKREEIQEEIYKEAEKNISTNYINLEKVLLRSITLPKTIEGAIEKKLKQEQESKEYEFKLIKEKLEAERKKIEAQGIKNFQDIVSKQISEKYLKWKGIEATLELAKSNSSKIVVINGGGKDGLPIIYNSKNE